MLAVVYLIFNEGYSAPPSRIELSAEAIRLGGALTELIPDEPEVWGLLALMLLHDSRRAARMRDGELVLLDDQDRTLWNREQINAGRAAFERSRALHDGGAAGIYTLQAAVAYLHTEDPRDWLQIAALYGELARLTRSPVVELNRAAALAEAIGPEAGLQALDGIDGIDEYHYLHAVRADLLRRLRRPADARVAYERALELAHSEPERRFLERRLAECGARAGCLPCARSGSSKSQPTGP